MKVSAVVLAAALVALGVLARPPQPAPRTNTGPVLPRPGFLHALFAGQQNLVADYFWVLTTYQIGSASTAAQLRDVYAYADLATTLDPQFRQVYWYAGVALPVQAGRDVYANASESTAILEKGAKAHPRDFKIKYQLAQNYMYLHRDFARAGALLMEVAKFPGAPKWLPSLAMRVYAEGGSLNTSLELANQQLAAAEDDDSRAFYARRLKEIQQEFVLRRIDEAAAAFAQQQGHPPKTVEELQHAGFVPELPADPLGGAYFFDEETGRAKSTASKHRFELIKPADPSPRND